MVVPVVKTGEFLPAVVAGSLAVRSSAGGPLIIDASAVDHHLSRWQQVVADHSATFTVQEILNQLDRMGADSVATHLVTIMDSAPAVIRRWRRRIAGP